MSSITLRSAKGSPLTNNEVDANFTNLNTDKLETSTADARYTQISNNLSDLASASTALTNLGLAATATEINYTDGVTSAIQTQIDALQRPSIAVTVANSGSGNKFYLDGTEQQVARLIPSVTYKFDQSDSSNAGHPLLLSTTSDGTHGGGASYTVGVTAVGTPGSAGAYTEVKLEQDSPDTLYYYCSNHSGMGGQVTVRATSVTLVDLGVNASASELNTLNGITASTSELNTLTGIPSTLTATELGYVDGVTSSIQTQIDSLGSSAGTTLTKTFTAGETSTMTLSDNVLVPVISVTKEVAQTGTTNNAWDVNSSSENYTRYNTATATTLTFAGLFDLSSASFVDSFDVSSQDTSPHGVAFNNDGTKMFIAGLQGLDINEYTLSSAFDVSTASFVDSFSVSSQDSAIRDVEFNADGTKMYVVGDTNNSIYEYHLSTAFDVSTASYDSTFSVAAQETNPSGMAFNTGGTKMFVLGRSGDDVGEYALSTGFDISTASFTDSFSVASQETGPEGIAFNTDGTKMFIVGEAGDDVNVYTLSTGFDVSTASYTSNFSISSQEADPTGIAFSASGDKMFIVGLAGDDVNEYQMPVTLALGSGSFASADVGKTIEANSGVFILTSTAGAFTTTTTPANYNQVASGSWQMYGVVFNTTDGDLELSGQVLTANLASPSQVATLNLATGGANISAPTGIFINSAGTRLFVTDDGPNDVIQLNLSTAFDITTGSYASKYLGVGNRDSNPSGLWFSPTGHRMFIGGKNGNNLLQFSVSSGNEFEINQYTFDGSFDVSSQSQDMKGVVFNPAGTTMIIVDDTDNALYQYTLSTAFTVSSASYASKSFSVSSQISSASSMGINSDGTKIFVSDFSSETVFEYELTTGFDLSTMSYTNRSYAMSGQMGSSAHLFILPDDESFISGENASSMIYEYSCSSSNVPTGYHAAHTNTSTDSTYWTDINSMTADEAAGNGNIYYCVSTDDRTTWKIAKGTDGERSIVRNNSGTWQYNSNGTYGSTTWANATTNAELAAIQEAMTGATGTTSQYDVSTASFVDSFSVSAQEADPSGVAFNNDGTKMFVTGVSGDDVNEYNLSTGFDVSTASYSQNFSVSSQATQPRDIVFNSDGTKMFIVSDTTGVRFVYQYNLSTGFDVSSASYSNYSVNVSSQDISPLSISFNTNGTKLFVLGNSNAKVFEYTVATGFDLNSTVTYSQEFSVTNEESNPKGLTFNNDGTKMYVCGANGDEVNEYNLTTAFNISTASAFQVFSVSSQDASPAGIVFNSDGTKMFIAGLSGIDINEYTVGATSYPNQMNKTQLDSIPDANHFALANDLDLAVIFNMSSGTTLPSSDGVAINYDANVLNQGAILGTDYNYDAPAQNKVRITSVNGANLKIRVI